MTILSVVQSATTVLGMNVPDAVYGNQAREMVEMRAHVARVSDLIVDEFDWQRLTRIGSIIGDGAQTEFDLPLDFHRFQKNSQLISQARPHCAFSHIPDANSWLRAISDQIWLAVPIWTLMGGKIVFQQPPSSGEVIRFTYISNQVVQPAAPEPPRPDFEADDDAYALPERILELGLIWNWKAAKSQPYAKELNDYEQALARAIGIDRGERTVTVGLGPSFDVPTAYPWTLG